VTIFKNKKNKILNTIRYQTTNLFLFSQKDFF
jgi:hypothetical protein